MLIAEDFSRSDANDGSSSTMAYEGHCKDTAAQKRQRAVSVPFMHYYTAPAIACDQAAPVGKCAVKSRADPLRWNARGIPTGIIYFARAHRVCSGQSKEGRVRGSVDFTFVEGMRTSPLVVFVHGLGMDKNVWVDPGRSRILGGTLPLTTCIARKPRGKAAVAGPRSAAVTIGDRPRNVSTLFQVLGSRGFHAVSWSQRRPVGPLSAAIEELDALLRRHRKFAGNGIVLIGHSRGGLIARGYALGAPAGVNAVITLGTPFRGSTVARWADLLARTIGLLTPLWRSLEGSLAKTATKRLRELIESVAVQELLPDSPCLGPLRKPLHSGTRSLCLAGTNPHLFSLYRIRAVRSADRGRTVTEPVRIFSFPESLDVVMPDELKRGRGDGLVSKESAILKSADVSGTHPLNHVGLLFSQAIHRKVLQFIDDVQHHDKDA